MARDKQNIAKYVNDIGLSKPGKYLKFIPNTPVRNDRGINIAENINIFPNPASHVLHLNSSNPDFSISELQIFTVDGKCLLQSSGVSELNISSLPAGLYFIRILDAFYQFEKI